MLDPRRLRGDELEGVAVALARRGYHLDRETLRALDGRRKSLQVRTEDLRHARNVRAREIGMAKSRGEDIEPMKAEVAELGVELASLTQQLRAVQGELQEFLLGIPNLPDVAVPDGMDEAQNRELKSWGTLPKFAFKPLDHIDLGVGGTLDPEAATRIAGSRFMVLRAPISRLYRALGQFMLDLHVREHGYHEVQVPYVVNADALVGTGQLPKFEEDLFRIDGDQGYYLIPTSEVSVTNLVRAQVLDAQDLPLRFVCMSPCFRSEAGSYGKDTKGMIRQHQFDKVELVCIARPGDSWRLWEELTRHAELVLEKLGLPYRRVDLCAGDLGFAAARTHDLEVWLPGQNRYREISSCSNFLDFQARRMRARWRNPKTGALEPVHTLNGSALAIGRTLVAVMENYQNKHGRIRVPEALLPYMDGMEIL